MDTETSVSAAGEPHEELVLCPLVLMNSTATARPGWGDGNGGLSGCVGGTRTGANLE